MNLFSTLVYNSDSELWNEFDLPKLKLAELQIIAQLWGAPKSGTKEKVAIRILAIRQVRIKMAPFSADAAGIRAMVAAFRKEALKHMARECGLWRSGNKSQLAQVLINWRERARFQGKKLMAELVAQSSQSPRQMDLGIAA